MGKNRNQVIVRASVIALIILYAGITALVESVTKILHPKTPNYTGVTLLIVVVAVVTKIVLGLWVKKQGVKANSESLINSGADALLDAVISVTTLAAAGSVSGIGAHRHSGYHDRRGNRPASAGYCR